MTDERSASVRADGKAAEAFRTISEAAAELAVPQHVLRFWETRFPQVKPLKRGGGRRYYRPEDMNLLRRIQALLYDEGYTIRGVQKLLKETGVKAVLAGGPGAPRDGRGDPAADVAERGPAGADGANGTGNGRHARPAPVPPDGTAPAVPRDKLRAVLSELEDIRRLLKR